MWKLVFMPTLFNIFIRIYIRIKMGIYYLFFIFFCLFYPYPCKFAVLSFWESFKGRQGGCASSDVWGVLVM